LFFGLEKANSNQYMRSSEITLFGTGAVAGLITFCCLTMLPGQTGAGEAFLQTLGDWEKSSTGKSLNKTISLASDAAAYELTYDIEIPNDFAPGKCTSRAWAFRGKNITLGMSSPAKANWYYQSFFSVNIDGETFHDVPGEFRVIRSGGSDAMLEGTWIGAKGTLTVRLAMRGGDDKLLMQFEPGSGLEGKPFEVRFVAYPQGFQEPRDRRLTTATRDLAASTGVDLDLDKETWAFFFDAIRAKESGGDGPCALAYVRDEVSAANVSLGAYAVTTRLRAKPGGRKITVGLWDFTSIADVESNRAYLREGGVMISKDLAGIMPRIHLAVNQVKTALFQPLNQFDKSVFAGVGLLAEHAFTKKYPAQT
jgi:hypothetical protein